MKKPGAFASKLIALTIAVSATGAIYLVDGMRIAESKARDALKLARQLSAQAESLTLSAREKNEPSPIAWSTRLLSETPEPRLATLTPVQLDPGTATGSTFTETESSFEYLRLFSPERGEGIKIEIPKTFTGFLGTPSYLLSDLAIFLVFITLYAIVFLLLNRNPEVPKLRENIANWSRTFKSDFTALGIHLREIIRAAQNMAVSASHSKIQVGALGAKLQAGITDAHLGVRSATEAEKCAKQAEAILLNALKTIPASARAQIEQAILCSRRAHVTAQSARVLFHQVEMQLEPIAMDADMALHPFDEFFAHTQAMSGEIAETTSAIKNLSGELNKISV